MTSIQTKRNEFRFVPVPGNTTRHDVNTVGDLQLVSGLQYTATGQRVYLTASDVGDASSVTDGGMMLERIGQVMTIQADTLWITWLADADESLPLVLAVMPPGWTTAEPSEWLGLEDARLLAASSVTAPYKVDLELAAFDPLTDEGVPAALRSGYQRRRFRYGVLRIHCNPKITSGQWVLWQSVDAGATYEPVRLWAVNRVTAAHTQVSTHTAGECAWSLPMVPWKISIYNNSGVSTIHYSVHVCQEVPTFDSRSVG
mgnify:CR=1 FL=1